MAPKPLRSQINQIRIWVRQGRTDAWVAHQLEVSADEIADFKKEHQLEIDGSNGEESTGGSPVSEDDVDLRAEDDALIAAELEAALAARAAQEEAAKAAAAIEVADSGN